MLEKGRFEMVRFCAYVLYASITVLLVASHSANWIAHDCWEKMEVNCAELVVVIQQACCHFQLLHTSLALLIPPGLPPLLKGLCLGTPAQRVII